MKKHLHDKHGKKHIQKLQKKLKKKLKVKFRKKLMKLLAKKGKVLEWKIEHKHATIFAAKEKKLIDRLKKEQNIF